MLTTQQTAPPARPNPIRQAVQRRMYRWHQLLGLVTVIPVIIWTLSGLSHPLMSNWLRPKIAKEVLPPVPAPRPTLPLRQVLQRQHLNQLRNVRVVRWQGQPAYQLLLATPTSVPRYFSAGTGAELGPDADRRFAEQLARYFTQDSTSRVVAAERLTGFTQDYPFVNRLLPVWKITFAAPNGLTVYVETMPARLAAFNNPTRAAFLRVFSWLHTWSWLELIGNNTVRVLVMMALLSVIMASTLSGLVIYGLMWRRFRRPRKADDQAGWLRKNHRVVGLAVSLVTLTFAFSGAWHALRKLQPDERLRYQHAPALAASRLRVDVTQLPLTWARVQNVALAEFNGQAYYQVFQLPAAEVAAGNGPSPKAGNSTGQPVEAVQVAAIAYYSSTTGEPLADGDTQYAQFLAGSFLAEKPQPTIEQTELIDHFEGEYGFINKRLPVVKVAYDTPTKTALYVEPATGRLAARVDNADRYEGLSFAFLHKYHGVGTLGKNLRDAVTMLAAAGVLAVSLLGLWLFVKVK